MADLSPKDKAIAEYLAAVFGISVEVSEQYAKTAQRDPFQTLLVAANYYDAMSEVGGARDALARLEQLRDAAAPVWQKLIDGSYGRAATLTKTEIDALGAALAGCATTQENT